MNMFNLFPTEIGINIDGCSTCSGCRGCIGGCQGCKGCTATGASGPEKDRETE